MPGRGRRRRGLWGRRVPLRRGLRRGLRLGLCMRRRRRLRGGAPRRSLRDAAERVAVVLNRRPRAPRGPLAALRSRRPLRCRCVRQWLQHRPWHTGWCTCAVLTLQCPHEPRKWRGVLETCAAHGGVCHSPRATSGCPCLLRCHMNKGRAGEGRGLQMAGMRYNTGAAGARPGLACERRGWAAAPQRRAVSRQLGRPPAPLTGPAVQSGPNA